MLFVPAARRSPADRTASRPGLIESLEKILEGFLAAVHERLHRVDWRRLYGAEKSVNLYGRAGAAALMCLQRDDFPTEILNELSRKR